MKKNIQMTPAEGAPEEFDLTIFPVNHNRSIGPAEGLALNLVKEAQRYLTMHLNSVHSSFAVDQNTVHLFGTVEIYLNQHVIDCFV